MKTHILLFTLMFFSLPCFSQKPQKSETIVLNGKKIHYEVYGEGSPLFLLHGYTLSSQYWKPYIKGYEDDFSVYVVDLYGHGKSEIFDENWSIEEATKSFQDLIVYLELDNIYGIGYSYGGDILFQLALKDAINVRAFVSIGAVGSWIAGENPESVDYFSMKNIENLPWTKELQESDDHIKAMLNYYPNYEVYISESQLQTITSKILLVLGDDDDSFELKEVDRVQNNLPNSDLWILPDSPHGAHEKNWTEFVRVTKEFFN